VPELLTLDFSGIISQVQLHHLQSAINNLQTIEIEVDQNSSVCLLFVCLQAALGFHPAIIIFVVQSAVRLHCASNKHGGQTSKDVTRFC
jgi:hypothetical protein